jgi:transposase
VVRFAYGLQKDIFALAAAVTTSSSSGQVEGQINRLKMTKRQMYGRAGFELLRARVLPYLPASTAGPAP